MVKLLAAFATIPLILTLIASATPLIDNERRGTEIGNGRRPPSKLSSNLLIRDTVDIEERDLSKRAGPSGQLLQPAGSAFIYTEVSWPGSGAPPSLTATEVRQALTDGPP